MKTHPLYCASDHVGIFGIKPADKLANVCVLGMPNKREDNRAFDRALI